MRFKNSVREIMDLEDSFYCRPRRKQIALAKCLDDFMEANAFEKRKSACFRCPQGRRNRENFAEGHMDEDD